MFNKHSSRNCRPETTEPKLPEVADQQSNYPNRDSDNVGDVAAFKVFLKRNLRHQTPPADLLGKIRGKIDKIKAEE